IRSATVRVAADCGFCAHWHASRPPAGTAITASPCRGEHRVEAGSMGAAISTASITRAAIYATASSRMMAIANQVKVRACAGQPAIGAARALPVLMLPPQEDRTLRTNDDHEPAGQQASYRTSQLLPQQPLLRPQASLLALRISTEFTSQARPQHAVRA